MQTNASFRRNRRLEAITLNDNISAWHAIVPFVQPVGTAQTPVGQKRDFGIAQQFQLAHDPIAASILSHSSTVWAKRVPRYPKWIRILQRFGWSVQRISHMRVYS